jgi:hypothetical protein
MAPGTVVTATTTTASNGVKTAVILQNGDGSLQLKLPPALPAGTALQLQIGESGESSQLRLLSINSQPLPATATPVPVSANNSGAPMGSPPTAAASAQTTAPVPLIVADQADPSATRGIVATLVSTQIGNAPPVTEAPFPKGTVFTVRIALIQPPVQANGGAVFQTNDPVNQAPNGTDRPLTSFTDVQLARQAYGQPPQSVAPAAASLLSDGLTPVPPPPPGSPGGQTASPEPIEPSAPPAAARPPTASPPPPADGPSPSGPATPTPPTNPRLDATNIAATPAETPPTTAKPGEPSIGATSPPTAPAPPATTAVTTEAAPLPPAAAVANASPSPMTASINAPVSSEASVAPTPSPSSLPQNLTGIIAPNRHQGLPLLQTSFGLLSLDTATDLPAGAIVTVEPLDDPTLPAPEDELASPAAAPPGAVVEEAIGVLRQIAPQTFLPNPAIPADLSYHLAAALIGLSGAIDSGNARPWLGDKLIKLLRKDERHGLIGRMESDLAALKSSVRMQLAGDWQCLILPLPLEQRIERIRLIVRRNKNKDDETENREDEGSRFLLDVTMSRLGALQIDGLLQRKSKRFDVILRSHTHLPEDIRRDIKMIFARSLEGMGMTGSASFQRTLTFIEPLPSVTSEISGWVI